MLSGMYVYKAVDFNTPMQVVWQLIQMFHITVVVIGLALEPMALR